MSYKVMKCEVCGKLYHLHSNGKITGASAGQVPCAHVLEKYSRRRGNIVDVNVSELENYMKGK